MRILIIYSTTEGQTRKIALALADQLARHSCKVVVHDVTKLPPALHPSEFDAVLIAARVHAGGYQHAVARFVRKHSTSLQKMPTAFVSVSMAAANHQPNDHERAAAYASNFFRKTGWEPQYVHHAAGARLYAQHNKVIRWILGIVDRHRYDTNQNHEFTDWSALGHFVDGWIPALRKAGEDHRLSVRCSGSALALADRVVDSDQRSLRDLGVCCWKHGECSWKHAT
jgi:menaquinone-dependent protoporphyrinogen oxidase